MTINEHVIAATQTASLVVSDLENALHQLNGLRASVRRTMSDKAEAAYLQSCLDAARRLQSDLAKISD